MDTVNFTGDPMIEIARAIGRIEAMIGPTVAKQDQHEKRLDELENRFNKFITQITLLGVLASGGVSFGAWVIEHWIIK